MTDKVELKKAQKTILDVYSRLAKKIGVHPSRSDMIKAGVSRDKIRHYFGGIQNLKEMAVANDPKAFSNILDETLFSPEARLELEDEIGKFSKFVITTAVGGAALHKGFYKSIQTYCKQNKAKLLVMMCEDPASIRKFSIPKGLENEQFIAHDVAINSNLFISTIKLSAKHIDPITGLARIGQKNGSFIYASPKQRLFFSPVRNRKLPHAIMTTGAITKPDYQTDRYMSERTAYIANNDHVMGAIVVEVADDREYHFRQIQAEKNGNFVDLGVYYKGDEVSEMRPEEFVLGDWHSGETNVAARKAWKEVVDLVKPRGIVLHDSFNGMSINHHEKAKKVKRAILSAEGKLSLEQELRVFAKDLDEVHAWTGRTTIVRSNHDDFLNEILEDGRYIHDPVNHKICSKLAVAMMDGANPLRYGAELCGLKSSNIRWLERDEDYEVAKIELGAHGDKGPNGARGNIKNMEVAYGNCVIGHSHTPGILRGCWQVGTSSDLDLDYAVGASSWMHTSCLVYPNGSRQFINVVYGRWRVKPENTLAKAA